MEADKRWKKPKSSIHPEKWPEQRVTKICGFSEVVLSCWQEEDVMSTSKKPLNPADFPVTAEGKKIKKQDGKPIANTEDPDLAADVAERLNDDEARREEDKWSA